MQTSTESPHALDSGFHAFVREAMKIRGVSSPSAFRVEPVPADGSRRRFFRIRPPSAPLTAVAVENPPDTPFFQRENRAYLKIGRHLRGCGVPVPEILHWDLDRGWFLIEDLGDRKLQDALIEGGRSADLAEAALASLFHMQTRGADGFDPSWCCQTPRYDRDLMRRYESDYFRDAFLTRYLGLERSWDALEAPFEHLAARAGRAEARFFLHRDFQSRNILVNEGKPGFVDWQGGRLGPLGYDLASFLIDPYVGFSEGERRRLYRAYLDLLCDHDPSRKGGFEDTYPYLAVQRNLQILGAFGFLTRSRGKPFFEAFIRPAAGTLQGLLADLGDPALRPLEEVLKETRGLWETPRRASH